MSQKSWKQEAGGSRRNNLASLPLLLIVFVAAGAQEPLLDSGLPPPASRLPPAAELEAEHAHIGAVTILNGNVFATDTPEEDKALFRLANRLHIKTRAET